MNGRYVWSPLIYALCAASAIVIHGPCHAEVTAVAVIRSSDERGFSGTIIASRSPSEEGTEIDGKYVERQGVVPDKGVFAFRDQSSDLDRWTVVTPTEMDRKGVAAIDKAKMLRGIERVRFLEKYADPNSSVIWKIIELDCRGMPVSDVVTAGSALDIDVIKKRVKAIESCDYDIGYPMLLLAGHKQELSSLQLEMDKAVQGGCCGVLHVLAVLAAGGDLELERLLKINLPHFKLNKPGKRGQFNFAALFSAIKDANKSAFITTKAAKSAMLRFANEEKSREAAIGALRDMRAWDVAEQLAADQPGEWNRSSDLILASYLINMREAAKAAGDRELTNNAIRLSAKVRMRSPKAMESAESIWKEFPELRVE